MPSYKLYYFPIKVRAEPARFVFAAAGVKYEDIRISFDDWPSHKQKMPFRQMPVLEVDGKQLSQSYAIVRYLANEFGLGGKDKWEAAEADQYTGAVEDLLGPVIRFYFESDEKRKAEGLKKFKEENAPAILPDLETALGKNSSGFLVGSGLTYADLCLLTLLEVMDGMLSKEDVSAVLSSYPNVQKHRQKIESLPKIAEWIKARPATDY
ncbi:glutathione S-transferase-like [Liolophura sinensis]|uniref:glutathione S-transferase-like n=1 Tax=Liolophura sinensis TaxID=3198878 RepID=UPI00315931E4